MRRYRLFFFTALFLTLSWMRGAGAEPVSLRGYGKVDATVNSQMSQFQCESEQKADILLGKLLADLFWDKGAGYEEKTVQINGKDMLVRVMPPYGALIAGRDGERVLIVGGSSEQEAIDLARKNPGFSSPSFQFKPSQPYPIYLDYYDLRAFKDYFNGIAGSSGNVLTRWDYIKQYFGGAGGEVGKKAQFSFSPAEGVIPWGPIDYEMAAAEKEGVLYVPGVGSGIWPTWAWNKYPQYIAGEASLSINGGGSITGGGTSPYEANPEGAGLTLQQREETSLGYMKTVMQRYLDSPALGGWQLYCGQYMYEMNYGCDVPDYSPLGQEGFRRWLREVQGLSLSALGERWYGDAGHFKDWSEVMLPERDSFVGNFGDDCLRISQGWFWTAAASGEAVPPADEAPGWVPVDMPPSRQIETMSKGPAFWRVQFDATDWMQQHTGKELYLVCDLNSYGWKTYAVFLNGKSLGTFKSEVRPFNGPISVKVTGLLMPGVNHLSLSIPDGPSGGYIKGPVFLTTTNPVGYPYLGKSQNARYVDMMEWRVYALDEKVREALEMARGIDPERPIYIPNKDVITADGLEEICGRLGVSRHDTGREADYRPFLPGTGYVSGYYSSSEPSGQVMTAELMNKMMGWMMIDGESDHFFWAFDNVPKLEKATGWFSKNQRLLQLFGKFLPEKPQIAILASSRNALLGDESKTKAVWDIGRGELESSHYNAVYASEGMVGRGLVDDYPVLFDSDSEIMSPEDIAAIKHYVENGGTFVALHNSGRHDILEPDTWPISALTGFKVLSVGKKGAIHFEKNLPVFKGWEGKTFTGEGSSLDWLNNDTAKDTGLELAAQGPDTVALAKWDDGTVAVGLHKIGKGQVIVLGSTFWRDGKDASGMWKTRSDMEGAFFEKLFTDLGIQRNATASDPNVWAKEHLTKNGLQEWVVAFNANGAVTKANLGFAVATKPDQVLDMLAQKPVAFEYEDGWITVKDVAFDPYQMQIFGVKRATLVGGIDAWWAEKLKYWKRGDLPTETKPADTSSAPPVAIEFDNWKFLADRDDSVGKSSGWTQIGFSGGAWRDIKTGPWNLQYDDLHDYQGTGLYRSLPFDLPAEWSGHRMTLNCDINGAGYFNSSEFYLNGKDLGDSNKLCHLDITALLQKEGNILAAKISGGSQLGGLANAALWIQEERNLDPSISLEGEWQAMSGDQVTSHAVTLPGTTQALYLEKEVMIPDSWQGKNVFFRFSSPNQRNAMILINGQPILCYGIGQEVNLTPFLRFGQPNQIQFWSRFTATRSKPNAQGVIPPDPQIGLNSVLVGCEAP